MLFILKSPVHSIRGQCLRVVSMHCVFHTGRFIYIADCILNLRLRPQTPTLLVNFRVVKVYLADRLTL